MNQLTGIVTHIQQSGSIMLVDVDIDGHDVSALMINSLEIPNWLCEEKSIGVIFKETEVSIGKDVRGKISLRNRFLCVFKSEQRGEILTLIELTFSGHTIKSAITTRSSDMLRLRIGDHVTAFIKANEVMLSELKEK